MIFSINYDKLTPTVKAKIDKDYRDWNKLSTDCLTEEGKTKLSADFNSACTALAPIKSQAELKTWCAGKDPQSLEYKMAGCEYVNFTRTLPNGTTITSNYPQKEIGMFNYDAVCPNAVKYLADPNISNLDVNGETLGEKLQYKEACIDIDNIPEYNTVM